MSKFPLLGLFNSEILSKLDSIIPPLISSQRKDIINLIKSHLPLFSYVPSQTQDCVDQVGGAEYVTKLDLLKGYWQVPLTPAFVTPDTFLQYTVMPFGMHNAPATFQCLVNTVLSGVDGCEVYLDDIVIYSGSWVEHLKPMYNVFGRLREGNLTPNLAKCKFGRANMTYLGKVVGRGQVKPVYTKVEAIVSFPPPRTPAFWGWWVTTGISVKIFHLWLLRLLTC